MYPAFKDVVGKIELNVRIQGKEERKKDESYQLKIMEEEKQRQLDESFNKKQGADKYAYLLEKQLDLLGMVKSNRKNFKDLENDLKNKQRVIDRLCKDIDDKTDSLKLAASEVMDLKRKIDKVREDNIKIKIQANKIAAIDEQAITNRKDLMMMEDEEIKNRILSISEAYRNERKRNEKLEGILKKAQKDIAGRTSMIEGLQKIKNDIRGFDQQGNMMSREFDRVTTYKRTIAKQEAMILKLEIMLKDMANDTKEIRREVRGVEEIENENLRLKHQTEKYQSANTHEIISKSKETISQLDSMIEGLRIQVESQIPREVNQEDLALNRINLEVRVEEMKTHAAALEVQLRKDAVKYGQEIVKLKAIIEEKNAIIKNIGIEA